MKKIQSIHFVGIKGVGMTPLAVIAREAGMQVSGSDEKTVYITDEILKKAGITPFAGFDISHITTPDLVITTGAHGGFDNVEVQEAKKRSIPVWTQGQAVGEFMKGDIFERSQVGISVAGCHGKTTTTAMVATVLQELMQEPSYVIGTGEIPSLSGPGHFGQGKYFIAEADEYATEPAYDKTAKFLWQHPKFAIITNIEYDHPDLYPTFEDLIAAYKMFVAQVIKDKGTVIVCGDDPILSSIAKEYPEIVTYGEQESNTYKLTEEINLQVLGKHNLMNALSVVALADLLQLPREKVLKALQRFQGTKRRLEYKGLTPEGALIFDDYAHHPTEIQKTIEALRNKFPDKKILIIFQPHTYSRTKLLLNEFAKSFSEANEVILTDIFPSAREPYDASISSEILAQKTGMNMPHVRYLSGLDDVLQYLHKRKSGKDSVIVTMGAGDVYTIIPQILEGN